MEDSALLVPAGSVQARGSGRAHLINLVHLALSFLLLFNAFSSVQNLATSILDKHELGFWSIATIYIFFLSSSLFVGVTVVTYARPKISVIVGALCYSSFIVANLPALAPQYGTLVPTAAVLGVGASIIWTAEGTYLTRAATNYALERGEAKESAIGMFNGIFFGIFQMNQVIGNLIAGLVLDNAKSASDPKAAIQTLMLIFIGLCGASMVSMFFLRREESPEPEKPLSVSAKVFRTIILFRDKRLLLLIFIFIYSGLEQSFNAGIFTKDVITDTVGTEKIGYIMSVFGVGNVICSFSFGRLADRWGSWPIVICGAVSQSIVFISTFYLVQTGQLYVWVVNNIWFLYVCAFLLAIGDAAWNTFPNTILGVYWPENAEAAFSNLKLWQSVGAVLPFALGGYIDLVWKLPAMILILVLGLVSLSLLQLFVAPLGAPKRSAQQDNTDS